jgi:hypothetical protein
MKPSRPYPSQKISASFSEPLDAALYRELPFAILKIDETQKVLGEAAENILNSLETLQEKLQTIRDIAEAQESLEKKEELLSVSKAFEETLGNLVSAVSFHDLSSQRLEKVKSSAEAVKEFLSSLKESLSKEPAPHAGGGYAGKPRARGDKGQGGFRGQGKDWSKDRDKGGKWDKDKAKGGAWSKDKDKDRDKGGKWDKDKAKGGAWSKDKKTSKDKDKGKPKWAKSGKAEAKSKPEFQAKDSEKKRKKAPPSNLKGPKLDGLAQSDIDKLLSEINDHERKD